MTWLSEQVSCKHDIWSYVTSTYFVCITTLNTQFEVLLMTDSFTFSQKKQRHMKRQNSPPSPEQTRGASSLPQKPDDNREQNVMGHNFKYKQGVYTTKYWATKHSNTQTTKCNKVLFCLLLEVVKSCFHNWREWALKD